MIFQFKINLKNVGVPVWRRLLVDSRTTFEEFHYILMAAFDWTGGHLHEFDVRKTDGTNLPFGEVRIGSNNNIDGAKEDAASNFFMPFPFYDDPVFNQKEEILSNWFWQEKDRVIYTYDFGDDWEHDIVLEKILEKDPNIHYPLCIKAKNDTPPEDSRYEVMTGEIDLINPDWKEMVEEINYVLDMNDLKSFFYEDF